MAEVMDNSIENKVGKEKNNTLSNFIIAGTLIALAGYLGTNVNPVKAEGNDKSKISYSEVSIKPSEEAKKMTLEDAIKYAKQNLKIEFSAETKFNGDNIKDPEIVIWDGNTIKLTITKNDNINSFNKALNVSNNSNASIIVGLKIEIPEFNISKTVYQPLNPKQETKVLINFSEEELNKLGLINAITLKPNVTAFAVPADQNSKF